MVAMSPELRAKTSMDQHSERLVMFPQLEISPEESTKTQALSIDLQLRPTLWINLRFQAQQLLKSLEFLLQYKKSNKYLILVLKF